MPDNTAFFTSDSPLKDETSVFPDRRAFAKQVSKAILNWRGRESCVVALNGAWGSGKTTVKNLILKELQTQSPPVPVLEFNPWQWNGSEQLWEGFLTELGDKLAQGLSSESEQQEEGTPADEKKKTAATRWRRFSLLLTGVAGLTRASKMYWLQHGIDPQTVDMTAAGLDTNAALAKGAAEDKGAEAVEPDKSLHEMKQELADSFRELEQPILVVMDDLDRLAPSEVKEIFQLIKANADFPNIIYLLLFQRETVEKSLQVALQIDGESYLEKIVQVPLDIPMTRPSQIAAQVEQNLQSVMGDRWQEVETNRRWKLFYPANVMPFFRTMRDVTRFFSSFSFLSAGLLQEVNPIDFLALELLRFFEKDVYQAVATSSKLLISPPFSNVEPLLANAKKQADELLGKASGTRRKTVEHMIVMLFPAAAKILGTGIFAVGDSSTTGFRDLRVCFYSLFDRYFIYAVPQEDVPRMEVVVFLDAQPSYDEVVQRLQEERRRGLFASFLNHLEAAIQGPSIHDAAPLFQALCDEVEQDYLIDGGNGDADFTVACAVAYHLLGDRSDGLEVLEQALTKSIACYVPSYIIHTLQDENFWRSRGFMPPFDASVWKPLERLCVDKIAMAGGNGSLPQHPKFQELLQFWREWDADTADTFLDHWLSKPEAILSLVRPFWQRLPLGNDNYRLSGIEHIEKRVSIPMLWAKIKGIDRDAFSEADQALIEAVEKYCQNRSEQANDGQKNTE